MSKLQPSVLARHFSSTATFYIRRKTNVAILDLEDVLAFTKKPPEDDRKPLQIVVSYTCNPTLMINPDGTVMDDDRKSYIMYGLLCHEILHQKYTNFDARNANHEKHGIKNQQLLADVENVLEDFAIETASPLIFGGTMLSSLEAMIDQVYETSPDIDAGIDPDKAYFFVVDQVMHALMCVANRGEPKGKWLTSEAEELFQQIYPIFMKAIRLSNGAKRMQKAFEIYKMLEPHIKTAYVKCTTDTNGAGKGERLPQYANYKFEEDPKNQPPKRQTQPSSSSPSPSSNSSSDNQTQSSDSNSSQSSSSTQTKKSENEKKSEPNSEEEKPKNAGSSSSSNSEASEKDETEEKGGTNGDESEKQDESGSKSSDDKTTEPESESENDKSEKSGNGNDTEETEEDNGGGNSGDSNETEDDAAESNSDGENGSDNETEDDSERSGGNKSGDESKEDDCESDTDSGEKNGDEEDAETDKESSSGSRDKNADDEETETDKENGADSDGGDNDADNEETETNEVGDSDSDGGDKDADDEENEADREGDADSDGGDSDADDEDEAGTEDDSDSEKGDKNAGNEEAEKDNEAYSDNQNPDDENEPTANTEEDDESDSDKKSKEFRPGEGITNTSEYDKERAARQAGEKEQTERFAEELQNTIDMIEAEEKAQQLAAEAQLMEIPKDSAVSIHRRWENRDQMTYNAVCDKMFTQISLLKRNLKRIFIGDTGDKKISEHGSRINVKRLSDGKLHTKIMDTYTAPKDIRNMCIYINVDESGSMEGTKCIAARECCITLYEALSGLNVPIAVTGFTSEGDWSLGTDKSLQYHYVTFNTKRDDKYKLAYIDAYRNNYDFVAISEAAAELKKRSEKHKIMIVLSDGAPCMLHRRNEKNMDPEAATKKAIDEARSDGIDVIGIAIESYRPLMYAAMYGKNFAMVDTNNLTEKVSSILKDIVNKWRDA